MSVRKHKQAILALGGGSKAWQPNRRIAEHLVKLSGAARPRVLYIPTAGGDREDRIEKFHRDYGKLGCRPEALCLINRNLRPSYTEIQKLVLGSDIIFVGGGNTYRMVKLWRRLGLDRLLRRAWEKGVVLSGGSAGGICWFKHGHSDSRRSSSPDDWDYIRVSGLGFIDASFCPHLHSGDRKESLLNMIRRCGGIWIACDDCAALEVVHGRWRIAAFTGKAGAYRMFRRKGGVAVQPLPVWGKAEPLRTLLCRKD